MKILIVGLGSMGRRRIRQIRKYNSRYAVYGVDMNSERVAYSEEEYGIIGYSNIDKVLGEVKFDAAFICTSPLSHSKIITQCLKKDVHIFSEINLTTEGYGENISLSTERGKVLFLSSTPLYRAEMLKIKEETNKIAGQINYIYHVGQYLPDWHPWENFKDYFVADKRTNGCRELFAIELPWLIDAFGKIKQTTAMKSKMSSLDIDYNDNYFVMIEHIGGNKGVLAVDVVSRKAVRNMEVFSENIHLHWDGTANGLSVFDIKSKEETKVQLYTSIKKEEGYSEFIVEDAYFNEVMAFFSIIEHGGKARYDFNDDKYVLELIDKIEAG